MLPIAFKKERTKPCALSSLFIHPGGSIALHDLQDPDDSLHIFFADTGGEAEDPDGMPELIQVSETEYNTLSRAMLVVMYLKDILNMLGEFEL